jgi:uncharacterized protein (TIGR02466 family)
MNSSSDIWAERFTPLWSTYIFQRRLAGANDHNPGIADLVMGLDTKRNDMTVDYKGVDFLQRPEPAIVWLREEVNTTFRDYLQTCNISYSVRGDIQAWPNVNRHGDYHGPHNHGWSYLSGTYYVQVPPLEAVAVGAGNSMRPAAITFSDPRHAATRHSIARDPDAAARFTVHPRPGTLLMWPSSLIHYVHPNLSDDIRISISFNIVLEWSNDYAG